MLRRGSGMSAGQGQPTWLMTFADLMTLLLTFFILLLSFSNMDAEKYKAIAGAMSQAFGVSFVASSQTVPTITVLTVADTTPVVTLNINEENKPTGSVQALPLQAATVQANVPDSLAEAAQFAENEDLAAVLIDTLEAQIDTGDVSVQYDADEVLLSFSERATFGSGSELLRDNMRDVLSKVVKVLRTCKGSIMVTGHSDDRPVSTGRFRSNWDLSAARAVSVVHELVLDGSLDARRVLAVGQAETHPLVPNDSMENRALNRRVEIRVQGAECRLDGL
jgi:chemotaxis protein MotB